MSEKREVFDMVIWLSHIIEIAAKRKKFTAKDNEISNVICGVLEAAGKVDKKVCLRFLERVNEDDEIRDYLGLKILPLSEVQSLLESLPEKEGK